MKRTLTEYDSRTGRESATTTEIVIGNEIGLETEIEIATVIAEADIHHQGITGAMREG
jgi:hypothetical protein